MKQCTIDALSIYVLEHGGINKSVFDRLVEIFEAAGERYDKRDCDAMIAELQKCRNDVHNKVHEILNSLVPPDDYMTESVFTSFKKRVAATAKGETVDDKGDNSGKSDGREKNKNLISEINGTLNAFVTKIEDLIRKSHRVVDPQTKKVFLNEISQSASAIEKERDTYVSGVRSKVAKDKSLIESIEKVEKDFNLKFKHCKEEIDKELANLKGSGPIPAPVPA